MRSCRLGAFCSIASFSFHLLLLVAAAVFHHLGGVTLACCGIICCSILHCAVGLSTVGLLVTGLLAVEIVGLFFCCRLAAVQYCSRTCCWLHCRISSCCSTVLVSRYRIFYSLRRSTTGGAHCTRCLTLDALEKRHARCLLSENSPAATMSKIREELQTT